MLVRLEKLCIFLKLGKTLADLGQSFCNLIKGSDQGARDLLTAISESGHTVSGSAVAYLKEELDWPL